MIQRAIELKAIYVSICNVDDDLVLFSLQESDWRYLTQLAKLLELFNTLTVTVSASIAYPTIPLTIAAYNRLIDRIEDFTTENVAAFPDICGGAAVAKAKLIKYYSATDSTSLYAVATAMHPKMRFWWWTKEKWEQQWQDQAQNSVREVWRTRYKNTQENTTSEIHQTAQDPKDDDDDPEDNLLSLEMTHEGDELEEYVGTRMIKAKTLEFWAKSEVTYPNLSRMAKEYLGIPATSASSERCFSQARILLPYTRNRLSPKKIREQILMGSWLKFFS